MVVTTVGAGLLALAGLQPAPPVAPIVGGEVVPADQWRSTVVVDFTIDLCSGTLIAPRVVLTAAHCLASSPPPELVEIRVGNRRAEPERVLGVDHYALHPDYCGNIFECGLDLHDFAYVYLAEAAPADAVVPRLPTDQATWDEAVYDGAPLVLAGFGSDENLEQGIKRAVEVELGGFSETGLEFFAGGDGKDSCQGDSGGPAYARLETGEVVLVGVNSRGLACGEGGYFGATPAALCWIGEALDMTWGPDDASCGIDTRPRRSRSEGCCSIGARPQPASAPWWLVVLAISRRRAARR